MTHRVPGGVHDAQAAGDVEQLAVGDVLVDLAGLEVAGHHAEHARAQPSPVARRRLPGARERRIDPVTHHARAGLPLHALQPTRMIRVRVRQHDAPDVARFLPQRLDRADDLLGSTLQPGVDQRQLAVGLDEDVRVDPGSQRADPVDVLRQLDRRTHRPRNFGSRFSARAAFSSW